MHNSKLKHLFLFLSGITCIFVYISLFLLFAYSVHQDITYYKRLSNLFLDEISSSINTSVKSITEKTISISQSVDFLYYSNRTDTKTITSTSDNISEESKTSLFSTKEVVAFSLYHSGSDIRRSYVKSYDYSDLRLKMEEIMNSLPKDHNTLYTYSSFHLDNQYYIAYSITKRYGTITVIISPASNTKLKLHNASYNYDRDVPLLTIVDKESLNNSTDYIKLNCSELYLTYKGTFQRILSDSHKIMAVMIIIMYLFIPFIFLAIYHLIIKPMNNVSLDMVEISNGNLDHRLSSSYYLNDINKLTLEINEMLDKIEEYQTSEFDSRMAAVQAKLQFLQLQIRPHFLLNCLKNLISLLNLQKYNEARELSFYLSEYIAYNFSDTRNFVSLKDELNSVQNYVKLYSLLSYKITLSFNINGESISAECLPLVILSFVENSIKHTKNISSLCINITTQIMNDSGDDKMLKILIKDNGGGFSQEYLDEFSKLDPSKIIYRKGKIGINNINNRLKLIYGDEASLRAYNDNSWAVIEIIQPYNHITEGGY